MEFITTILEALNDREELASLVIKGLDDENVKVVSMEADYGKLWIITPKDGTRYQKEACIVLSEDKKNHSITLKGKVKDNSTSYNNTATYYFYEEDDQFFNLFVLINKNCLLR